MQTGQQIWILEDDPEARLVYQEILELRYQIEIFSDLISLQEAILASSKGAKVLPDMMIVDLRLPDGNFLEMLKKENRFRVLSTSFLVVSACDDLDVLRACFSEGALDYLTKPFTKSELIVKIERLLNFQKNNCTTKKGLTTSADGLEFDPAALTIRRAGNVISNLTAKELQIFSILSHEKEKSVSRQELQRRVWKEVSVSSKALDVHLFNLRKKIAKLNLEIRFIPPDNYLLSQRMDPKVNVG